MDNITYKKDDRVQMDGYVYHITRITDKRVYYENIQNRDDKNSKSRIAFDILLKKNNAKIVVDGKIKVYSLTQGSTTFCDTDPKAILEYLEIEMQENMQIGDTQEFIFGVLEMTEEQILNSGEFDGF